MPVPNPFITRLIIIFGALAILFAGTVGEAAADTTNTEASSVEVISVPPFELEVTSTAVKVNLQSNGDLRIVGDAGANFVELRANGDLYDVVIHAPDGSATTQTVGPVTRNVIVDLEGDDDTLWIGQTGGKFRIPNSLSLTGDGVTWIWNTAIGEDLLVRPTQQPSPTGAGIVLYDVQIGDDLDYQPGDTNTIFRAFQTAVGSRAMFIAQTDGLRVKTSGFGAGRVLAFGSPNRDDIHFWRSNLGADPVVNLGDGSDRLDFVAHASWSGTFVFSGGEGHDQVHAWPTFSTPAAPLPAVDLRMGPGDDLIKLYGGLADDGAGSVIRGHTGTDSLVSYGAVTEATIIAVENIS